MNQFKKELSEGYSWSYCCRTIVGGTAKIKSYFKTNAELKYLHENYINRKLDENK